MTQPAAILVTTTLLIRADASTAIGTGHVMRCLALAQGWKRADGRAVFVQAETTAALEGRLRDEGFEIVRLDTSRGSREDALETAALARRQGANWVVADGYSFGSAWQKCIRDAGLRLLVIDDCGHAEHYHANLILNQNLGADESLYGRRDADTRLLLGPRFALLRKEFLEQPRETRVHPEVARKVLVTLGGSDPENVTERVVRALQQVEGIEAKIVVGGSNPHLASVKSAIGNRTESLQLAVNATNMPELMMWADIAISAAGSTAWELAYLGVPALLIITAENQSGIATELDTMGAARSLGEAGALPLDTIAAAIAALRDDAQQRREMSERARVSVSGHGASRTVAALGEPLRLTFLTDANTWFNPFLAEFIAELQQQGHTVSWIHEPDALPLGDLAFFLSLGRVVPASLLERNVHNLVVHASAVPAGRGWSPLTWQILEGKNEIPITLLEAAARVDRGEIHAQSIIRLRGDELIGELRALQAGATLDLCRRFVAGYPFCLNESRAQAGEASYYPRRRPADSQLDPDKTIREQFNLLRVSDPEAYPAFFELAGRRYELRISANPVRPQ